MAARKRPSPGRAWTPDVVRERIQTALLVNRLSDHAFGKVDMTQTQMRAAEILLNKTLPNLSAVEHSGEVETRYVMEIPAPSATAAEWQAQQKSSIQ